MALLDLLNETPEAPDQGQTAGVPTAGRRSYAHDELVAFVLGGVPDGQRNSALLSVAGYLRKRDLAPEMVDAIVCMVNRQSQKPLTDREVRGILRSAERYRTAPEMRECKATDLLTMGDARDRYYTERRQWGMTRTGIDGIDSRLSVMLPHEVLIVAGRSGTGKTNLGLQLLDRMARHFKAKGLFLSLEMGAGGIFFRCANVWYSRVSSAARSAHETAGFLGEDANRGEAIVQSWDSVVIVDRDSQTVEQVEEYLIQARQAHGPIPVMAIDYMGYLSDKGASNYDRVSLIAKKVKALAKRQNCRVILITQTSREGQDGTTPVKLHHLRDSGVAEESGDWILGMWCDAEEKNRIHLEWLKCRAGERGHRFDLMNRGLDLIETEYKETSAGF